MAQTRTMRIGQTGQAVSCLVRPTTSIRIPLAQTRPSSSSSKTHSRPSSSAQPLTKATVPSTSSTASTSLDAVNPPPSTHPADLSIPDPVPASATTTTKLKRYVALGRAYFSFYKTGLKNVYHNYRTSLPLRRELGVVPIYLPVSPPGSSPKAKGTFRTTLQRTQLTRSNFQLIRRAAFDVRRMIPFSLMLVVCGEFTPLIVLATGSAIVPMTCRVPAQFAKDRAKQTSRKRAALVAHAVQETGSVSQVVRGDAELELLATHYASPTWVDGCSNEDVLRACAVFGLVGTHARPSGLVALVYRKRLRRFVEYLAIDDGLISRGGGVSAMQAVEVRRAVEERGGIELVYGVEEGWDAEREQRRWLEAWLERRRDICLH